MPLKRVYLYLAISVVVVAIGVGLTLWTRQSQAPSGVQVQSKGSTAAPSQQSQIGGPFTLTDHMGRQVTPADYKGKYMLVYFGYTYCPDVCPTTLTNISEALDLLGEDAKQVQPLFITVDPKRDTTEQLKMYVGHFHPSLVGLTGTPDQVKAAMAAYKVYAKKVAEDSDDPDSYLMDHTSLMYLMGPDGSFLKFIPASASPETIAIAIKDRLGGVATAGN